MFQDSELKGADDGVVCFHLQKKVGEHPVLDLENKLVMLKMVNFSGVEIHGKAGQFRKNRSKLADTGLLTDMDVLEIQVMAFEKPVVRFGEVTTHQVYVLSRIF